MRVPLEILRLILDHLAAMVTTSELKTLRLVNSTFNDEILDLLFTDSDQLAYSAFLPKTGREHHPIKIAHMNRVAFDTRFINSAKWTTTPPTLQKKYMAFRLKRSIDQPSLFAGLLTGVRQMLSDTPTFPSTEPDLTDSLLSLCAHDRITSWIVAHHSPNLFKLVPHLSALNRARTRPLHPQPSPSASPDPYLPSWTSEIELGYHHALVCHHLLLSSWPLAHHHLTYHALSIHTTSLCFGTSILGFAIQKSSLAILATLLAARPLTKYPARCGPVISSAPDAGALERHSVYDVLAMATRRPDTTTVPEALALLYAHMSARGVFTGSTDADALFVKAVATGCTPLVDFLVEKVDLEMYGRRYVEVFGGWIEEVEGRGGPGCFRGWRPFAVRLGTEWPKWSGRLMRERVESLKRSRRVLCERMEREGRGGEIALREGRGQ